MGNITVLIPTKNQEDLNSEKIASLLSEKFNDLTIERSLEFNSIQILDKKDNIITDLYFDQECYMIEFEEDLEFLKTGDSGLSKEITDNLIFWLNKLKELNPEDSNEWKGPSLQMTYGYDYNIKLDIEFFLRDYFEAYIFDEGIHPEFMPPDYKRTSKSKIKKWYDFLKK